MQTVGNTQKALSSKSWERSIVLRVRRTTDDEDVREYDDADDVHDATAAGLPHSLCKGS